MNEIIGSLLLFIILIGLVFSVFAVSKTYLEQWKQDVIIDREIELLRSIDSMIDEMKHEGKSSRRIVYTRLFEPMLGKDYILFSHSFGSSRMVHVGNVYAGKSESMNCTRNAGIFKMGNGKIEATFSIKDGSFNISETFLSISDGVDVASINDLYLDIDGKIDIVEGSTTTYSSPVYCSITYNITSPLNMTLKYSLSSLSDYIKMEVDYW